MKKSLFILLAFVVTSLPSFAILTTDEAVSQDYIQNHGYSSEMSRLIDLQNAQINGAKSTYKKNEPAWYSNKPVSFIRKTFIYFDPGLDDEKFMQHNINYTNKWSDF